MLHEEVSVKLHFFAQRSGSDSPDGEGAEMMYSCVKFCCGGAVFASKQIIFLFQVCADTHYSSCQGKTCLLICLVSCFHQYDERSQVSPGTSATGRHFLFVLNYSLHPSTLLLLWLGRLMWSTGLLCVIKTSHRVSCTVYLFYKLYNCLVWVSMVNFSAAWSESCFKRIFHSAKNKSLEGQT